MLNRRQIKLAALVCLLLLVCIVMVLLIYQDHQYCMNVRLIKDTALSGYTEDPSLDISNLLFNGKKVAYDSEYNTIYISQPSDKLVHSSELIGTLESTASSHSLYFLKDSAMYDISKTVSGAGSLTLAVVSGNSLRKVNVVITTLPVLRLEEVQVHQDETGQDIITGEYILWGGSTSSSKDYSVVSGTTQWHVRGQSSAVLPKKSWKLSLRDANGENSNQNLLGLGSDDDWILNAMGRDDTKVREKFALDLWNQYLFDPTNEYPMSCAQYVEVILNNEYLGLYLLMRRVDAKYLQLDQQQDILLKGMNTWSPGTLEEGYEIISSPYSKEETYQLLETVLKNIGGESISLENYTKTNVFINLCSAPDNAGYKNMFYILRPSEAGYVLYLVPWDMDMTMGITYIDGLGFVYDYAQSMNQLITRIEYPSMKERHSQLDQIMADHWAEYRTLAYSETLIEDLLSKNIKTICSSGAFDRDVQKWGCLYAGKDSHSALLQWCKERLSVLDSFYSGF